ncbi:MAG: type II secretion system F family protein [Thermoproteus sp.]
MLKRLSPNQELAFVLGVKLEELRKTGLLLAGAMAGLGAAIAAFGILVHQTMFLMVSLAIFLMAPVLYLYPVFELKSRVGRLEGEMLPAAVYATIYAAAERDMSEGFFAVASNPGVAPTLASLAKGVERLQIKRLIPTPYEALGETARLFEGSRVADFLVTISVARTIGLSQYIQARDLLRSVLFELKTAYARLAENLKVLGEVILVFFGVLPLMLFIMTSIFYGPGTSIQLPAYTFVAIPLMTLALAFLVDSAYPKTPEKFTRLYKLYGIGVGIGAVVGAASYFLLSAVPLSIHVSSQQGIIFLPDIKKAYVIAIALGLGSMAATAFVIPKYLSESSRRWNITAALPFFTRDLSELVKTGLSPAQAVVRLMERKTYNKQFDRFMKGVMRQIASGKTFYEAMMAEGSKAPWFARVVLSAAAEAERLGARHEIFAELADTSRELVDILKAARSNVRGAVIFGLMTIAIIAVMLGGVVKTLLFQVADYASGITTAAAGGIPANIQLITWNEVPAVLKYSLLGVVINSVALGILTGKTGEGNFLASSLYGFIAALIATASVIASMFI